MSDLKKTGGGIYWRSLFGVVLLVAAPMSLAMTNEELERWFEDDSLSQPYKDKGSEGGLQLLPLQVGQIPYSKTHLAITAQSLEQGWVGLEQCHGQLDAVPDAEVVYRFREMRGLRIHAAEQIGQAWVEGQSVQLKDVAHNARLCVTAEVRILTQAHGHAYQLRYGPFQRRFLDSYFPYHVTLAITYPAELIALSTIMPHPQPGLELRQAPGRVELEAWFTGKLTFNIEFAR